MIVIKRGMIIDADLNPTKGSETGKMRPCVVVTNNFYNERVPVIQVIPITDWSEKKARILTNVEIQPTDENGLTKMSVADCLQTRPIDYRMRLVKIRGNVSNADLHKINSALKKVFDLK